MTLAQLPATSSLDVTGNVKLVSSTDLLDHLAEADRAGLLSVLVPPPGPGERGQLAVVIEEAIESCLIRRGACGPGIGAAADLDGSLSDQLYRARLVELRGIALGLPPLDGIATLAGTLDAEDSAVLRWWLRAATERPVHVYLDERNRYLGVYGRPVPLHELVGENFARAVSASEPAPAVVPDVAHSIAAMDLATVLEPAEREEARPLEKEREESPAEVERANEASIAEDPPAAREVADPEPASDLVAALLADLVERHVEEAHAQEGATPLAPLVAEELESSEAESSPGVEAPAAEAREEAVAAEPREEAVASEPNGAAVIAAAEEPEIVAVEPPRDEAPVLAPPLRPAHGPLNPLASQQWADWVRDLESARGPKPLGAVERMFVTSYVPLRDALMRGIAEPRAAATLDAWATSFAQSYKEAFPALCVRGKRPTMVVDVPDLALRIARLHGARSVQLVLVDGMRFDLGLRVEQQLRVLLGQEVALTERLLLWSCLPATTAAQLELLGRGPEALREWTSDVSSEIPVARGRSASTPRRIKAGHRELLKLDIVEARLSEAGPDEASRLEALADETADALAAYIGRLPARTLVMVFGDHGFLLDPIEGGTAKARQGGTRPEEVLVPAFAWLIGGLH
jgi:hypothetical protein